MPSDRRTTTALFIVTAGLLVLLGDRLSARNGRNPCTPGPVRQSPTRISGARANAVTAGAALDVSG